MSTSTKPETYRVLLRHGKAAQPPVPGTYYACRRCGAALEKGEPMASYQLIDRLGDDLPGTYRTVCNDCGEDMVKHYRDTLHMTVWSHRDGTDGVEVWEFMRAAAA